MTAFLQFAIVGLGAGAAYALLAEGVVIIYRGSGVVNFAHGAVGMACAYLFYQLWSTYSWPLAVSLILSLAAAALIGLLFHVLVMRPLRHASPVVRTIGTLGVLVVLQGGVVLIWGSTPQFVPQFLPASSWTFSGITVTEQTVIIFVLALVLTAIAWWLLHRTNVGRATLAVSESERSVAALGWSPDVLAATSWVAGSLLAGIAGIVITPLIGELDTTTLTLAVITAVAAALVGGFLSLPWTLLGALVIGMAAAELPRYWSGDPSGNTVPFLAIVVMLVVRGQSLPARGHIFDRLPTLGQGRLKRPELSVIALAIVCALILWAFSDNAVSALTASLLGAMIILSVILLTGYAGQMSLAQYAVAGMAALTAGRLSEAGWGFVPACLAGIALAAVAGTIVAIPALRTRGVNLAIVTLGLGLATQVAIFNSTSLTGGLSGINVRQPTLFGLNLTATVYPRRYAIVVVLVFAVWAFVVGNIRRGRVGRRLIAMRANERSAAALGINVFEAKIFAFAVSSLIAGTAGVLLGFTYAAVVFDIFSPLNSILILAYAVIGGLGYVSGAISGAFLVAGGLGTLVVTDIFGDGATNWVAFIGGVLVITNLIAAPDGLAKLTIGQIDWVRARLRQRSGARAATAFAAARHASGQVPAETGARADVARVEPRELGVENLTVTFGGVTAVSDVSFRVRPGEVVGLIGPNGAGKTTIIDALTGFVSPSQGTVRLGADDVSQWSAHRRVRRGLSRSFQSGELFDDLTVEDNLRVASDPRDRRSYLTDLVWPGKTPLSAGVGQIVQDFGISDSMSDHVTDLSHGKRQLLATARAVVTRPSVLLLDEPGAGLGEAEVPELVRLVRGLAVDTGMAVMVVEHDMDFVMSVCDRVIVLDFGRKIAEGTPAEVRSDGAVIAAYLGVADDNDLSPGPDTAQAARVGSADESQQETPLEQTP
jgi:ABC-type branched-subunit amino acid transport system ATPase component/branched-subunit amino acid ABC-type transport system permease component